MLTIDPDNLLQFRERRDRPKPSRSGTKKAPGWGLLWVAICLLWLFLPRHADASIRRDTVVDCNGEQPEIDRSGVIWKGANSLQNPLVFPLPHGIGKSRLVMPRLVGELIVDASVHHDHSVATDQVPGFLQDRRVIVAREPTMGYDLPSENSVTAIGNGSFSVFVANLVLHSFGAHSNFEYRCRCFWRDEKSGQMASVFDREFERNSILALDKYNATGGLYIGSIDPWSLFGLHFIQLAGENPPTRASEKRGYRGDDNDYYVKRGAYLLIAVLAACLSILSAFKGMYRGGYLGGCIACLCFPLTAISLFCFLYGALNFAFP